MGQHLAELPRHINVAREALQPVDGDWLFDRLSTMQLAMTNGWSEAKATAWLHETHRLLADLPQGILSTAIDKAIMASERGFMPSVGEIRALADPRCNERRRVLRRLETVAALPDPASAPKPATINPPSEAEREAIKAEYGLTTVPYQEARKPAGGPAKTPSAADLEEIAKAVGINLAARDVVPAAPIDGLTVTEIFAQRDRRRAAQMREAAEASAAADAAYQARDLEPLVKVERASVADELEDVDRFLG